MKTAFLIDGDFFLRRLRRLRGDMPADRVVSTLIEMCNKHLSALGRDPNQLYRILFYDCPPLTKKLHQPISKKFVDWSKTPTYAFRIAFHDQLRVQRKVALRLGSLGDKYGHWMIRPEVTKDLLAGKVTFADLTDEHFVYEIKQKGVDMRIGLDIASISSKRLCDQIVLVAGDSDFIPAAKTARREGVDFVLDSMGAPIPPELHEHIDGLQSVLDRERPQNDPPPDLEQ